MHGYDEIFNSIIPVLYESLNTMTQMYILKVQQIYLSILNIMTWIKQESFLYLN